MADTFGFGYRRECLLGLHPGRTMCEEFREGMPVKASSWLTLVVLVSGGNASRATSWPNRGLMLIL